MWSEYTAGMQSSHKMTRNFNIFPAPANDTPAWLALLQAEEIRTFLQAYSIILYLCRTCHFMCAQTSVSWDCCCSRASDIHISNPDRLVRSFGLLYDRPGQGWENSNVTWLSWWVFRMVDIQSKYYYIFMAVILRLVTETSSYIFSRGQWPKIHDHPQCCFLRCLKIEGFRIVNRSICYDAIFL